MKDRAVFLTFAAVAAFAVAACGPASTANTRYDCDTGVQESYGLTTQSDTQGVFSINGGPPSGPSGVNTCIPVPVQAVPGQFFDVVMDIEGTQAYILPPRAVSAAGSAGWISSTQPFDSIKNAPTTGYNDSTPLAVQAGSVFMMQALSHDCAALPYQNQRYVYSKFVIDSVHYFAYNDTTAPSGLTVYYRIRSDPVCGFTSLLPGVPPN